ncbi:hypothetical protein HYDPIDRAFT_132494 [Hydnomerulius pinastri MD-312]|uniref:Wax synthase domain-containing protein n=1 Tax=Hydnomerulius pinastri MD-312 TaxID=994086 RepID=A0A0C9WF70_9AGAM|nr:hypothetical protein HYDPIDRAFT_132494 [Hydnomerulius pinastri MD-312]
MWSYIHESAHNAYRILIPYPDDRIPIQTHHIPNLILPFIPFLYMAYLTRRPDTFTLRLMLLPLVLCLAFGTYFRFMYTKPEDNIYNWGQGAGPGLLAEAMSAKAIDFAWRREGMLKIGEVKPGVLCTPKGSSGSAHTANGNASSHESGSATSPYTEPPQHSFLPPWLYDTLEVLLTTRGLGWQFGVGVHVPKARRPLERSAFLRATVLSIIKNYLIFDALESFIKLIPEVGSLQGGTIFKPSLPIPQRYILSTAIHLATGSCLLAGFEMIYDLITLFALSVLSSTPAMWPPIMDNPWTSDSLHIFWARRWHQVLRETFFIYGGFPGKIVAGRIGMLFGTFIGSGVYHEFAAYTLGRGFDWHVILFFTLQAPLLLLEKVWHRLTGHRVGGVYGRLWLYFCMFVLAQPLVDSWHSRGLGGAPIIPPSISITKKFFIPLLQRTGFDPSWVINTFLEGR